MGSGLGTLSQVIRANSEHEYHMRAKPSEKRHSTQSPSPRGGYGKPRGNKHGQNLTGLLKLKLRTEGIRIVYMLERASQTMTILVVSVRDDMQVYDAASIRRNTPLR